jgi:hypothetical protein
LRGVANARVIPDALDPEETLEIERRWLPKAGILAIVAGILPLIAIVLQISTSRGIPNEVEKVKTVAQSLTIYGAGEQGAGLAGAQAQIAEHYGNNALSIVLATLFAGLSLVCISPVLYGLLRSAWRRRPSFPRWFFWAPVVGSLLFAVGTTVAMAYGASKMSDFAALAPEMQTNWAASDALNAARDDLGALSILAVLGQMLVAVGIGSAALSAMNVGLLTRVMGFLGVMLAVLVVVPLLDQQGLLRAFWFIAIGVTLLGKWPSGRPAAWETGTPQPWPTRAEMMEAAERAREAQQSELDEPAPKPKAGSGGRKRRK